MVHLEKENFIGKRALERDAKQGVARQLVGLEVDWTEVEATLRTLRAHSGSARQASRVAVPVYSGDKQVGKATTTTLSPMLKKMIALGQPGDRVFEAGHRRFRWNSRSKRCG